MVSSSQVPVWLMDAAARHACAIKCINARGSGVTRQMHYHDISHLLIHNLTYKARTLSTLTWQTERPPGLPSMTTVFHNTNKPEDVSSRPSLWLSGEACLNGSHCRRICHPLFCHRLWRETKDDELMGLNILLTATGMGLCNENKHNKMHDIAFQMYTYIYVYKNTYILDMHCDLCKTALNISATRGQKFHCLEFSLLLLNPALPSSLVES